MGKLYAGWKKAVVWNPSNGDKVQVNTLSTEHSDFPYENVKSETPTGQAYAGKVYPPVVGFLDAEAVAQLETWMESTTPVCIAIYSLAGRQFIAIDKEEIHVVPGMGVDTRTGVDVHRFEWETRGKDPNVIWKQNIAEGLTYSNGVAELVLPLEGVRWTVAADYDNDNGTLIVRALDYAGAELAVASQALPPGGGRATATINTPADTWKLELDMINSGTANFSNVSMRADDKSEYVDY